MRRFENYWMEESGWEADQLERFRRRQQRRTREERKRQRIAQYLLLLAGIVLIAIWITLPAEIKSEPVISPVKTAATAVQERPEDFENEKIEAALVEQGYFRDDIPLDYETQALLRAACCESGVEYELALAVIRKESTYRNVTGDDGASTGYMQVQSRWHRERMERLGVTDLQDPFSNFRVGCDYLAELLDKYPLKEALTAYNTGKPGHSTYAETVLEYREELLA